MLMQLLSNSRIRHFVVQCRACLLGRPLILFYFIANGGTAFVRRDISFYPV